MSSESFPTRGVSHIIQILDSIIYFCVINARDAKQRYLSNWPSKLLGIIALEVKRRHGVRLLASTILKHPVKRAPQAFILPGRREYCKNALEALEKEEDKLWVEAFENREETWKGGPVPILLPAGQIRIGGRKAKTLEELEKAEACKTGSRG